MDRKRAGRRQDWSRWLRKAKQFRVVAACGDVVKFPGTRDFEAGDSSIKHLHLTVSSAILDAVSTFIVVVALAAAAIGAFLLITRDATLLFEAHVLQGRVVRLRGRAPKRLIQDFQEVLRQRPVPSATIRVHSSGGSVELRVTGDIRDGELQRLRNVLGTFPIARIRAEPYRKA